MATDRNEFGSYLAGFIIGGLVGAAVALLLAPQSGEETRAIIKEKSIELKDKASESIDEARVKAEHAVEDARLRVEELSRAVREKAQSLQHSESIPVEVKAPKPPEV